MSSTTRQPSSPSTSLSILSQLLRGFLRIVAHRRLLALSILSQLLREEAGRHGRRGEEHFQFFPSCFEFLSLYSAVQERLSLSILSQLLREDGTFSVTFEFQSFNSFPVASRRSRARGLRGGGVVLSILSQLLRGEAARVELNGRVAFQFFPSCFSLKLAFEKGEGGLLSILSQLLPSAHARAHCCS